MWLGIFGRRKLAALEELLGILEKRLDETQKAFNALDLEMTDRVDRLNGIAKRIQGRRGGRPPAQENGDAKSEDSPTEEIPLGFSRHVL